MADLAAPVCAGSAGSPPAATAVPSELSACKIKVVVTCLLGTTFATSLLPLMALRFVMARMGEKLGWSPTDFHLAATCQMWAGALTIWPFGWLTDRIGARPVILTGAVGIGLVTLAIPYVQNRWECYALFTLLGVFGSSAASYAKVIAALFTRHRGRAIALFGAESTVVQMLIPTVIGGLLLQCGWRGMFTVLGAVILLTTAALFLGVEEPGAREAGPLFEIRRKPRAPGLAGMPVGEVLRDRVFWLLLLVGLAVGMAGRGLQANVAAAMGDHGFTREAVAQAQSVGTLLAVPGILLVGVLMDRMRTAKVAVPFHLSVAASAVMLMLASPMVGGRPLLVAALALFSATFLSSLAMTFYFLARFFGLRSFASIYGVLAAIQAVCMGFAPSIFGRIYDTTHSFRLGFLMEIAASLLAAGVFMTLPAYRFPRPAGSRAAPAEEEARRRARSPAAMAAE